MINQEFHWKNVRQIIGISSRSSPVVVIINVVAILKRVNLSTASAHYLDATVSFLVTVAMKISQSQVTQKSISLDDLEYIINWILRAMVNIKANLITEVTRKKSTERAHLVDTCLRPQASYSDVTSPQFDDSLLFDDSPIVHSPFPDDANDYDLMHEPRIPINADFYHPDNMNDMITGRRTRASVFATFVIGNQIEGSLLLKANKLSDEDDSVPCPVCFYEITDPADIAIQDNCTHNICRTCIRQWFQTR